MLFFRIEVNMPKDKLCLLPPELDVETKVVLKKLASTLVFGVNLRENRLRKEKP
jgi:hypothetical protein